MRRAVEIKSDGKIEVRYGGGGGGEVEEEAAQRHSDQAQSQ